MPDIQWDAEASLMRVGEYRTSETMEELVGRGTLTELVSGFLDLPPDRQRGLMIRAAGPDWSQEFDADAIRELAARPEFTSAFGDFDTAALAEDTDREQVLPDPVTQDGLGDVVRQPGGSADDGTLG